jgi:hypothetical protein
MFNVGLNRLAYTNLARSSLYRPNIEDKENFLEIEEIHT